MKKYIFGILLLALSFNQDSFSGYLRTTEVSFCMDDCGMFYIESESASGAVQTEYPLYFDEDIEFEMYLNRFVEVTVDDEEINCIECSAFRVLRIDLSQDCISPVNCFVDPCEVAEECQLNTPTDCVANYCGGCYADFYDLENNLVNCYEDDPGPNPCSDFGQEDCEWFDECIWTDSGCQDAVWEDECSQLSQDECSDTIGCQWNYEIDECHRSDDGDNDGPPECLIDCQGIEDINPDEDPYGACDWIISTLSFDAAFGCAQDCDEETMIEISEIIEACYNCLEDSTLDCADVFDDDDCSDLSQDECSDTEGCDWVITYEEIGDEVIVTEECVRLEEEPDGCFSDEGEWYCVGCELFINECEFYDCTHEGWSDLITLDTSECNNNWECSDFNSEDECVTYDCDWQLSPAGIGQCVEGGGFDPVCEDLSDYFFGWCDMVIGIGWNGEECTWYSGCGAVDDNGVDHSESFFDSIEECEAVCLGNQQGNGHLYGTVEYIWGDAIEMVAGALVLITSPNAFLTTQTNEAGYYSIELPQGQYSVSVEAYGEYQVQDVYVMENQEHQLNFIFGEFYYETALAGHVYCEDCANGFIPIVEARVLIANPNNWFSVETFTNEDGFFWANVPSSGMYNVSISSDGYIDFDDYIFIQGITDWEFYLDTDNSGGDGYAVLSLENIVASPGSEVSIPLLLESDLAVAGVQFSVYTLGEGFPNYISGVELNSMNDCFTASSNSIGGAFIGIIFSLEGCTYPPDETNHIADLIYEVSNNVPSGLELFLEFESTLVSDTEGNEILSYGEGATILFGMLGDVNSDGYINILDVISIVNFAIYIEDPNDSEFWAADLNSDGMLDILDIVIIVNMILDN